MALLKWHYLGIVACDAGISTENYLVGIKYLATYCVIFRMCCALFIVL